MESPEFLDVTDLLERSRVVRRPAWLWYSTAVFMLFLVLSALAGRSQDRGAVLGLLALAMVLVATGVTAGLAYATARVHRAERLAVEAVEELVQLRRWPEAATVLRQVLSRPMRSDGHRVQALIYLSGVLARYERFADAIGVQEYILEHVALDDATAHGLRLGRAMAMLRDDRLFDADRAISELRRSPLAESSGGLALVEMYRDVKTGHPAEALETFAARRDVMRRQLGHRLADGLVLAARAHDLLKRPAEAQQAFEQATLLCPWVELQRRYPEVRDLAARYALAAAPAEMA